MQPLIKVGDATDHGGVVISGSGLFLIDGVAVARVGDSVSCPISGHGPTAIVTGDNAILIENKPAARHGDKCACGATLLASQGSGRV